MVAKGDVYIITEVKKASGSQGRILETEAAPFGVLEGPEVKAGDALEVGSVCNGWCFIYIQGEKVQAQILSRGDEAVQAG